MDVRRHAPSTEILVPATHVVIVRQQESDDRREYHRPLPGGPMTRIVFFGARAQRFDEIAKDRRVHRAGADAVMRMPRSRLSQRFLLRPCDAVASLEKK